MKPNEVKKALSVLYEIEGDAPLLMDHTSSDSDKYIELICGSLVDVRKGTLQVVHLTVKEFLRANDESRDSVPAELPIDTEKASLMLTYICLECIRSDCS